MYQPDIKKPETENGGNLNFFDSQAVEAAQPVVPLGEIESADAGGRFYVPVKAAPKHFGPAVLVLVLFLSTGVLAGIGTLAYHSALALTMESKPVNAVTAV